MSSRNVGNQLPEGGPQLKTGVLWLFVLFYVLFVLYCSMYCLCVNVYCHRVTTQLQLTNISYHILSYHTQSQSES